MIVNKVAYSHASVEARIEAEGISYTTQEITEVGYDDEVEPGELRGTSSEILGRTRGEYKPSGKLKMSKKAHNELIAVMGPGFFLKPVTLVVAYEEPELGLIVDTLQYCRIKKNSGSSSKGSDPNEVECDLAPIKILWNGIDGSAVEST